MTFVKGAWICDVSWLFLTDIMPKYIIGYIMLVYEIPSESLMRNKNFILPVVNNLMI